MQLAASVQQLQDGPNSKPNLFYSYDVNNTNFVLKKLLVVVKFCFANVNIQNI